MRTKLFFLIAVYCFLYASSAKAIQHIRWGSSGDPLNGLTITWRNGGTADSIRWGYTSSYEMGKFAGARRNGYAQYIFKYTFPSATPNAMIYYTLYDSNTKTWGSPMNYKTAPASATNTFTFLGVGDSRSNMSIWSQVATQSNSKNANFTLYTGDIVNSGGTTSDWDNWFNNGTQYIGNNLIYHSHGNHEASGGGTTVYQNLFDLPQANGTNLYYSFTYGNAVFVALNSESPSNSAQATWLTNTLQANQNKTWKIVFFHRPFYTIGPHAGEMNSYYNTWWKAFDDYGVDLVINGHDHMYERTKPINRSVSTTAPVSTYGSGPGQGRCEIVTGGAGATLYTGSPTWFIQKYQSVYNYTQFEVQDCKIKITAYNNNGALIDSLTLNKCTTGMEEVNNPEFNPINLVPNPAEGMFTLHYSSAMEGEAIIKLFDLTGREISSEKVMKDEPELKHDYYLAGYAKGVYTVQVIMDRQVDSALLILK